MLLCKDLFRGPAQAKKWKLSCFMPRLFQSSLKSYPLDPGAHTEFLKPSEICPVVHFTLQRMRNVYGLTLPALSALESCSDITSVLRQLKRSRKGALSLPLLELDGSHTHLKVMCRSIFAMTAVTVRIRSVARPYTVHPASAKDRGDRTVLCELTFQKEV